MLQVVGEAGFHNNIVYTPSPQLAPALTDWLVETTSITTALEHNYNTLRLTIGRAYFSSFPSGCFD
jgi:chorismate-pyruvate lyase